MDRRFKRKNVIGLLGVSFLFLCLSFIPRGFVATAETGRSGEGNELLSIGKARVAQGNLAQAKEQAISQALAKGVEDYVVHMLGHQRVANNFQRLTEEIIPGLVEGIENFLILAENQVGDEYIIFVRVKVNEKLIEERLTESGLALMEGPSLRVLFLVSEVRDGSVSYWWKDPDERPAFSATELALHNAFLRHGFSPINRANVPEVPSSPEMRLPDLASSDALTWGRLFGADVVIYGQSSVLGSKEVSVNLQALSVKGAVRTGHGTEKAVLEKGPDHKAAVSKALDKVVGRLAKRLVPEIMKAASAGGVTARHLEVTLKALLNPGQYRAFRDFLQEDVVGVNSVRQTRMGYDYMSLDIEFLGEKDEFVKLVLNHKRLPFPLDLNETEKGELIFSMRR